jgi:predicted nuclease with TOPRIM domain
MSEAQTPTEIAEDVHSSHRPAFAPESEEKDAIRAFLELERQYPMLKLNLRESFEERDELQRLKCMNASLLEVAQELYRELAEYKTKYNKLKDFIEEKVEHVDDYFEPEKEEHTNHLSALVNEKIKELEDDFPPDLDNGKIKDIVDRVYRENHHNDIEELVKAGKVSLPYDGADAYM